jgi:mono/diheme cytochrome c family protein
MKKIFNRKSKLTIGSLLLFVFMLCKAPAAIGQQPKPWVAPESAKKVTNPVAVSEQTTAAGKILYTKSCKSCHGSGGKGDGPKAANLNTTCQDMTKDAFKSQSDGEIFWKTTEGRDDMPSFKTKLSNEERWQIINYIRTFGGKRN